MHGFIWVLGQGNVTLDRASLKIDQNKGCGRGTNDNLPPAYWLEAAQPPARDGHVERLPCSIFAELEDTHRVVR